MFVVFGDGRSGARLPSGTNNVRATYRKGLGVDGNVVAGSLTQLMTRPLGLKSVSNPLPAEGGTDPEAASAARQSIPLDDAHAWPGRVGARLRGFRPRLQRASPRRRPACCR